MTDSRKGYVRMRTLQAVVLLIFGVIILRLAYIQLIDPKYENWRAATRCGTSSNTHRAEKSSTATASTWRRTAPATT